MLASIRRKLPALGAAAILASLALFAAADEGDAEVEIVAPDQVSEGQVIQGAVIGYTPPLTLLATLASDGSPMPGTPVCANFSGPILFFIPTQEGMAIDFVHLLAGDVKGKLDSKLVLVTY